MLTRNRSFTRHFRQRVRLGILGQLSSKLRNCGYCCAPDLDPLPVYHRFGVLAYPPFNEPVLALLHGASASRDYSAR